MRVLILTEGGKGLGIGHIIRCCVLYDEVASRDIAVKLIVNTSEFNEVLFADRDVALADWLSIGYLEDNIESSDYCIVDSYCANKDLYDFISKQAEKSLFIDDYARLSYPKEIIVNPSFDPYLLYDNIDNNYLLGSKYIILRAPFVRSKREELNETVKNVLIIMGGTDIRNITYKIIENLCPKYQNIKFHVVTDNLSIEKRLNVNLYRNLSAEQMKKLMLKCDIAITATGQTVFELIATRTPIIPIQVAENQINNSLALERLKLVKCVIKYDDSKLINKIETYLTELFGQKARRDFSFYAGIDIDGMGSKRLVEKLIGNS